MAKLQSEKSKNLGVKTLVKAATTLGGAEDRAEESVARMAHVTRPVAAAKAARGAK